MKRLAIAAVFLTFAAATSPLFAQDDGQRGDGRRAPSPVKEQMEKLDEALEAIGKFLEKPEGEAPMAQLAAAQAALHEAKQHAPRSTQRQPEGQQAAYVVDYKVQLNKTLRAALDLEDAMLAKDWAAAGKALAKLEELKKAGHDKFKPRRRRGGEGGEGGGGGREGGGGDK